MSVSREALPTGADSAQAVRSLLLLPVKALQTERGRRLVAALGLALALQGMVGLMFANPDLPSSATTPAAAVQKAPEAQAGAGAAAASKRTLTTQAPTAAGTYAKPQDAAVAWFARRAGVAPDKVRALQQLAAGNGKVKVLVMAESGDRVDTDEVTVVRTKSGWKAP
jgi:hypothetical protein